MTKVQLVRAISKETGIDQPTVLATVESFMNVVKDSLISKENVYLRGFGTFEVRTRKGREKARNPKTGELVAVDTHGVAIFRPGKELKDCIWDLRDAKTED